MCGVFPLARSSRRTDARTGFPVGIGCRDPRSQKRDLRAPFDLHLAEYISERIGIPFGIGLDLLRSICCGDMGSLREVWLPTQAKKRLEWATQCLCC